MRVSTSKKSQPAGRPGRWNVWLLYSLFSQVLFYIDKSEGFSLVNIFVMLLLMHFQCLAPTCNRGSAGIRPGAIDIFIFGCQ